MQIGKQVVQIFASAYPYPHILDLIDLRKSLRIKYLNGVKCYAAGSTCPSSSEGVLFFKRRKDDKTRFKSHRASKLKLGF